MGKRGAGKGKGREGREGEGGKGREGREGRGAASRENVRYCDDIDQTVQRTDSVVLHRRRRRAQRMREVGVGGNAVSDNAVVHADEQTGGSFTRCHPRPALLSAMRLLDDAMVQRGWRGWRGSYLWVKGESKA